MDMDQVSKIIEVAIQEGLKKALAPAAEPYKVNNKTKSVSEIITEKKLSFKDKGSDTLSATRSVELMGKSVENARTKDSYRPTEEQMQKINSVTLVDRTKENQGYVFTFQATNLEGAPDRSYEGFSEQANKQMGMLAVKNKIPFLVASKSDCEDHTWKAINSYGTVIDAWTEKGGLFYTMFVPENKSTSDVLERVFDGQINKLSVGFAMSYSDVKCNSCKSRSIVDEDCPHYPGDMDEQGKTVTMTIDKVKDNYEISGVAVPCQAEANIVGNKEVKMSKNSKSFDSEFVNLETAEKVKSLIELQAEGVDLVESTKKIAEILDSVEENPNIDKISNDNIEVNNLMDQEVDKKIETEAPAEAVVNVGLTEERLCKVAENIKNQVVAELSAKLAEMPVVDLTPVLDEIKSLNKKIEALKEDLKVAEAVPVSPAAAALIKESFQAPSAAESLNISTDQMIVY